MVLKQFKKFIIKIKLKSKDWEVEIIVFKNLFLL